ncbi:MAG: hypothetical protein Q8M15_16815 [Bacteroidota bacterium]|nr:hypothetical protein [Bacteroidota bacterium]
MAFTGNENHDISLQDASDLTKNYRDTQSGSDYIKGEFFGKTALLAVLNQDDCVGIRIYYGIDSDNIPKLVIVGADANEDDLTEGIIMEVGKLCPPYCSTSNLLNS